MRVVIFGATGATGECLVAGAVQRGHAVTAFARERTKVALRDTVDVAVGDATDPVAVAAAVANHDAVLVALGPRTLAANPLLPCAGKNIVAAMHGARVKRLIVLGAAGALRDSGKHQTALTRFGFALFKLTLLRNPFLMQARLQQIVESSDLEYTMVLPPRLLDGPRVGTYRVATDGLPPNGSTVRRADLAEFMLDILDRATYVREAPYIAY